MARRPGLPATWERPDVSLALAERYAAAFVDLETPSAIDQLTSCA